jgi:hypothetical protein
MSRLITASLVGSVRWLQECPPSWKDRAKQDLVGAVNRSKKWQDTPATLLGKDFESKVYQYADKTFDSGSEHFKWFVEQCKGGIFQKKTSKIIVVDGEQYCLFGYTDVWFPDVVKDIKTTSNYKGASHYLNSFQHLLYLYSEHISRFQYLVAEFQEGESRIKDHYMIEYEVKDWDELETNIVQKVRSTITFLSDRGLMEAYLTKFCRNNS